MMHSNLQRSCYLEPVELGENVKIQGNLSDLFLHIVLSRSADEGLDNSKSCMDDRMRRPLMCAWEGGRE